MIMFVEYKYTWQNNLSIYINHILQLAFLTLAHKKHSEYILLDM